MATVLKKNYSLVGTSLVPLLKRAKTFSCPDGLPFSRMSQSQLTEDMTVPELAREFSALTGESLTDCLALCGREVNVANARIMLHLAILYANEVGQPRGQELRKSTAEPVVTVTPPKRPRTEVESQPAESLQSRVDNLEKIQLESSSNKVLELKTKVRALALQNPPSEPLLLLAYDELARAARKTAHGEADVYEELARQAAKYQGKINIATLGLSIISDKASDTVTKALSKCLKEKQIDETVDSSIKPTEPQKSPLSTLYPPYQSQFANASPALPPFMAPYPGMFAPHYPGAMRHRYPTYQNQTQRQNRSPRGVCLFCESADHYVKDCDKMKAAKRKN